MLERSPFAELADKLERQPVHNGDVILSWQTRDEVVDRLRQADALTMVLPFSLRWRSVFRGRAH